MTHFDTNAQRMRLPRSEFPPWVRSFERWEYLCVLSFASLGISGVIGFIQLVLVWWFTHGYTVPLIKLVNAWVHLTYPYVLTLTSIVAVLLFIYFLCTSTSRLADAEERGRHAVEEDIATLKIFTIIFLPPVFPLALAVLVFVICLGVICLVGYLIWTITRSLLRGA